MNNTVLAGLIVGTVVVAGAGAVAVNSGFNPFQKYATVVAVEPAFDTNQIPREVCGDEATIAAARAAGLPPAAPQAAPPEAAPPQAPAKDAKPAQSGKPGEAPVETCVTIYDTESIAAGFDVTYELDGVQSVVRMDRDPGERLPVEDGEIVVSQI